MYTYLLGWSQHNKFYYGVRYSKLAKPSELWVTYKTSSKHVKAFAEKHGDPDIIQIRKTFTDRLKAIQWEHKVLRRMKVASSMLFLNASENRAPYNKPTYNPSTNFKNARKFKDWSIEVQEHVRSTSKQNIEKLWSSGKLTGEKNCTSDNYITAAKERWANPEFKAKQKSRKWMNNGKISKMIPGDSIDLYISNNWQMGRI